MLKKLNLQDEGGYTIIEVLVAIQLTFIVISFIYVSYLFTTKLINKWQEKVETEEYLTMVSNVLSRQLMDITQIYQANRHYVAAKTVEKDTLELSIAHGLRLNGLNLGNDKFEIKEGEIIYYSKVGLQIYKQENLGAGDLKDIKGVEIRLTVIRNKKEHTIHILERLLKLRNPSIANEL